MNLLPLMLCYERTVLVASVHVSASTCDLAALVGVSVCLGPSLQMERQLLIMKSCFEAFHMHWHTNYPCIRLVSASRWKPLVTLPSLPSRFAKDKVE